MAKEEIDRLRYLLQCAIAWKTVATQARCGACGARTNRTSEEIALERAIEKIEENEAEAPTRPKGKRLSSRPPK